MAQITPEEARILAKFLKELKDYKEAETKKKFIPRQISVIYQHPDKPKEFRWFSCHRWFDKVFKNEGISKNILLITLHISANVIINLETLLKKKHLLGRANEKRLEKAIELLKRIKFKFR